jgi:hypothetical protein
LRKAGEVVLRDDGRVIGFEDRDIDPGSKPVFVEGLTDIVDVSGDAAGFAFGNQEAAWIALRRDGTVYQWNASVSCQGFCQPVPVPGLANIVSISSLSGTHLAVDRGGQLWGGGAMMAISRARHRRGAPRHRGAATSHQYRFPARGLERSAQRWITAVLSEVVSSFATADPENWSQVRPIIGSAEKPIAIVV